MATPSTQFRPRVHEAAWPTEFATFLLENAFAPLDFLESTVRKLCQRLRAPTNVRFTAPVSGACAAAIKVSLASIAVF